MKNLLAIIFVWVLLPGCLPLEEEQKVISFWTSMEIDTEDEVELLINDSGVGTFSKSFNSPDCMEVGLIQVAMDRADMNLQVKGKAGDIHDLGLINLYSVSQGLKVQPKTDSSIFVTQGLDDSCTMVRLLW